ncbi:MAG: hypothetical protein ACQESR_06580 [Planctomycetota bacterium]
MAHHARAPLGEKLLKKQDALRQVSDSASGPVATLGSHSKTILVDPCLVAAERSEAALGNRSAGVRSAAGLNLHGFFQRTAARWL